MSQDHTWKWRAVVSYEYCLPTCTNVIATRKKWEIKLIGIFKYFFVEVSEF
jgi:hypothetical protein